MFFRFNRRFNVLKVEDDFARLVSIHRNGNLDFEFTYDVSQLDIVKRNALSVNVSVVSRTIKRKPLLQDSHRGNINTKQLINNILTQIHDAKTAVREQENYTVAHKVSDISSKINNTIVSQLRAGVPPSQIPSLAKTKIVYKPAVELKLGNDDKPLLQYLAHSSIQSVELLTSASVNLNVRRTMHEMIFRQGLDPSYIADLTHRSVPAVDSFGGLLRATRAPAMSFDPSVSLLNHHILGAGSDPERSLTSEVQDDTVVHVAEIVISDEIDIPVRITIPRHARAREGADVSHFLVKFDLIDSRTRTSVDTIIKPLDVARHIQLYYTPRRAPLVKVGTSVATRINLQIKQRDPGATGVNVYRKTLARTEPEIDDYVLIGTFPLTPTQPALNVPVEQPTHSTHLYRVVPTGQLGTLGFEYTNVVLRPNRYTPSKALSINAQITQSGIVVEAHELPSSAVAIEILVRNLSIFESDYRNVGTDVFLVDDATRVTDYISATDPNVTEGWVYEYVARITYESGLKELAGHTAIEFIKLTPGKVDLKITDLETVLDGTEPNVKFTVNSDIIDTDIDVVLALLQRQDIRQYFDNDIAREREFLKSLTAHNIQRVDVTTGEREDFGVITTSLFDDQVLQKNNAVKPLKFGHRYRYEVATLLRAPETMFENFVKQAIDPVTKKAYRFKPSKFLHPIALRKGTIVTPPGLRTRFSHDAMTHGLIGTLQSIEVSFEIQPARIVDASTARFNRELNVITWKLEGQIDQIDHFLIMKDVHGVRTIVGKAHSEFPFGNCQYLHRLSSKDAGPLQYVVTPVFNSYQVGIPVNTNSVIV